MKKVLFTFINFLFVIIGFGQTVETILNKNIRMQTEVFELDTKEPTQLSFLRKYDNNVIIRMMPVRKLETHVSRFTAFKIKNINPLRYNYFINDELVTQFMEQTPSSTSSLLSNGLVPVGDISTLSIFNFINKPNDAKEQVIYSELKTSIKEIKSKIAKNYNEVKGLYDRQYEYINKDSTYRISGKVAIVEKGKEKQYKSISDSIRLNNDNYAQLSNDFENKLQETLNIVSKLNIKSYATLKNLPDNLNKFSTSSYVELQQSVNNITTAVEKLNVENSISADIEKLVRKALTCVSGDDNLSETFSNFRNKTTNGLYKYLDTLNQKLNEIGFYSQTIAQLLSSSNNYNLGYTYVDNRKTRQKFIEEIIDITDFISVKKSKELEDFLVNSYLEIGKLLQIQYTEVSRKVNALKSANYIDNVTDLSEIEKYKTSISQTFTFIQSMSADFGIITRSLKVDDTQFRDIVNNITVNYFKLLDYLKKLDFVSKNNTVEYSLPTHNNLRNIDLIRYKIDRQDIITNSKQSYTYDIWLKGGLKIDFSAGIFGSGLTNSEFNKIPYYKDTIGLPIALDSVYIVRKDKGGFNFAFGAMVNVYRRNGANWLNWGGSVGIVYTESQKLQFLLGPSLHFGKTERLILHGGVAMGFIDELDKSSLTILNEADKNRWLVKGNLTSVTPSTISRFSTKWFFGISYNLSKKSALQAVSSQTGYKYYNSELNPSTTTTPN